MAHAKGIFVFRMRSQPPSSSSKSITLASSAIAVMSRGRRGGHVGIITGIDAQGNPIMISGNSGNRVREAPVSRGRIYAYVMPN